MNTLKAFSFLVLLLFFGSCSERFPMDKRYWTPEDYEKVIFEIEYNTPEGEEFPRFAEPESATVIRKLVDAENYKVTLEDSELGLNFRNEVSQEFFTNYKNLSSLYSRTNRQDQYIYAEELIEIHKFGLGFQLQYFSLGNERIKKESDSPEDASTKEVLGKNEQTIIHNFNLYLDDIEHEDQFSTFAPALAEGITVHFFK